MIIRLYIICVFLVLIKVSLQLTVEGFIGDSVVLPCSSDEGGHGPQNIEVHWRHNGKIVHDIIKGKDSVEHQDSWYKNRSESFPEEYLGGNFSIILYNLSHTDAGEYTCLITHSSEYKTVELIINETIIENGTKSSDQGTQKPDTDESTPSWLWVYIIVAVLIMLIVCFIIIAFRKKLQAVLFSPVRMEDKEQRQE